MYRSWNYVAIPFLRSHYAGVHELHWVIRGNQHRGSRLAKALRYDHRYIKPSRARGDTCGDNRGLWRERRSHHQLDRKLIGVTRHVPTAIAACKPGIP